MSFISPKHDHDLCTGTFKSEVNDNPPGYLNLGNTCYANSVVSGILDSVWFRNTLDLIKPDLKAMLKDLVYKSCSRSYQYLNIEKLLECFGRDNNGFDASRQEDAGEFLAQFLTWLYPHDVFKSLFSRSQNITDYCSSCAQNFGPSIYDVPFLTLAQRAELNFDLNDLLSFEQAAQLIEGRTCCFCDAAESIYRLEKTIVVPPVLFIQFINTDIVGEKIQYTLTAPDILNYNDRLFSKTYTIFHLGRNYRSGHYISNVIINEAIYKLDDQSCERIWTTNDAPYLLCYIDMEYFASQPNSLPICTTSDINFLFSLNRFSVDTIHDACVEHPTYANALYVYAAAGSCSPKNPVFFSHFKAFMHEMCKKYGLSERKSLLDFSGLFSSYGIDKHLIACYFHDDQFSSDSSKVCAYVSTLLGDWIYKNNILDLKNAQLMYDQNDYIVINKRIASRYFSKLIGNQQDVLLLLNEICSRSLGSQFYTLREIESYLNGHKQYTSQNIKNRVLEQVRSTSLFRSVDLDRHVKYIRNKCKMTNTSKLQELYTDYISQVPLISDSLASDLSETLYQTIISIEKTRAVILNEFRSLQAMGKVWFGRKVLQTWICDMYLNSEISLSVLECEVRILEGLNETTYEMSRQVLLVLYEHRVLSLDNVPDLWYHVSHNFASVVATYSLFLSLVQDVWKVHVLYMFSVDHVTSTIMCLCLTGIKLSPEDIYNSCTNMRCFITFTDFLTVYCRKLEIFENIGDNIATIIVSYFIGTDIRYDKGCPDFVSICKKDHRFKDFPESQILKTAKCFTDMYMIWKVQLNYIDVSYEQLYQIYRNELHFSLSQYFDYTFFLYNFGLLDSVFKMDIDWEALCAQSFEQLNSWRNENLDRSVVCKRITIKPGYCEHKTFIECVYIWYLHGLCRFINDCVSPTTFVDLWKSWKHRHKISCVEFLKIVTVLQSVNLIQLPFDQICHEEQLLWSESLQDAFVIVNVQKPISDVFKCVMYKLDLVCRASRGEIQKSGCSVIHSGSTSSTSFIGEENSSAVLPVELSDRDVLYDEGGSCSTSAGIPSPPEFQYVLLRSDYKIILDNIRFLDADNIETIKDFILHNYSAHLRGSRLENVLDQFEINGDYFTTSSDRLDQKIIDFFQLYLPVDFSQAVELWMADTNMSCSSTLFKFELQRLYASGSCQNHTITEHKLATLFREYPPLLRKQHGDYNWTTYGTNSCFWWKWCEYGIDKKGNRELKKNLYETNREHYASLLRLKIANYLENVSNATPNTLRTNWKTSEFSLYVTRTDFSRIAEDVIQLKNGLQMDVIQDQMNAIQDHTQIISNDFIRVASDIIPSKEREPMDVIEIHTPPTCSIMKNAFALDGFDKIRKRILSFFIIRQFDSEAQASAFYSKSIDRHHCSRKEWRSCVREMWVYFQVVDFLQSNKINRIDQATVCRRDNNFIRNLCTMEDYVLCVNEFFKPKHFPVRSILYGDRYNCILSHIKRVDTCDEDAIQQVLNELDNSQTRTFSVVEVLGLLADNSDFFITPCVKLIQKIARFWKLHRPSALNNAVACWKMSSVFLCPSALFISELQNLMSSGFLEYYTQDQHDVAKWLLEYPASCISRAYKHFKKAGPKIRNMRKLMQDMYTTNRDYYVSIQQTKIASYLKGIEIQADTSLVSIWKSSGFFEYVSKDEFIRVARRQITRFMENPLDVNTLTPRIFELSDSEELQIFPLDAIQLPLFPCRLCPEGFDNEESWSNHVSNVHQGMERYRSLLFASVQERYPCDIPPSIHRLCIEKFYDTCQNLQVLQDGCLFCGRWFPEADKYSWSSFEDGTNNVRNLTLLKPVLQSWKLSALAYFRKWGAQNGAAGYSVEELLAHSIPCPNLYKLTNDEIILLDVLETSGTNCEMQLLNRWLVDVSCEHKTWDRFRCCLDCISDFENSKRLIPKFSFANDLLIGAKPEPLKDLTGAEIMFISRARTFHKLVPLVTEGRYTKYPQQAQKGHCISFPSTAHEILNRLPRSMASVFDILLVYYTGPRGNVTKCKPLEVRRSKVYAALLWLKSHNKYYQDIQIDTENLNALPENNAGEIMPEFITYAQCIDARRLPTNEDLKSHLLKTEDVTEAMDGRQGDYVFPDLGEDVPHMQPWTQAFKRVHIDHSNYKKPRNTIEGVQSFVASHGSTPLSNFRAEYWSYAFPTIFHHGDGCIGIQRDTFITNDELFRCLLLRRNLDVRYHLDFLSVAFSTSSIQKITNSSRIYVKRRTTGSLRNTRIGSKLLAQASETLANVSSLREALRVPNLPDEVRKLLRELMIVQSKVPGTDAMRDQMRYDLNAMCEQFGPPDLFFTLNPADTRHPMVLKFVKPDGKYVPFDLLDHPLGASAMTPAKFAQLISADPVTSVQFFHFILKVVFKELFGVDLSQKFRFASSTQPSIIGDVRAFYGVKETTSRGSLHIHIPIWLVRPWDNLDELITYTESKYFAADGIYDRFLKYYKSIAVSSVSSLPKVLGGSDILLDPLQWTDWHLGQTPHTLSESEKKANLRFEEERPVFEASLERNPCAVFPSLARSHQLSSSDFSKISCIAARDRISHSLVHTCIKNCKKRSPDCRMRFWHDVLVHNFSKETKLPKNSRIVRKKIDMNNEDYENCHTVIVRKPGRKLQSSDSVDRDPSSFGSMSLHRDHPWMCTTIPALILTAMCNHDIQPMMRLIPSDYKSLNISQDDLWEELRAMITRSVHALAYYVTKYCAKDQRLIEGLLGLLAQCQSILTMENDYVNASVAEQVRRTLIRMNNCIAKRNPKPLQEICYLMLGESENLASHRFSSLYTTQFLNLADAYEPHSDNSVEVEETFSLQLGDSGSKKSVESSHTQSKTKKKYVRKKPAASAQRFETDAETTSDEGSQSEEEESKDAVHLFNQRMLYVNRCENDDSILKNCPLLWYVSSTRTVFRHMVKKTDMYQKFRSDYACSKKKVQQILPYETWYIPRIIGTPIPAKGEADIKRAKLLLLLTKPWIEIADLLRLQNGNFCNNWEDAWNDWHVYLQKQSTTIGFLSDGWYAYKSLSYIKNVDFLSAARSQKPSNFGTFEAELFDEIDVQEPEEPDGIYNDIDYNDEQSVRNVCSPIWRPNADIWFSILRGKTNEMNQAVQNYMRPLFNSLDFTFNQNLDETYITRPIDETIFQSSSHNTLIANEYKSWRAAQLLDTNDDNDDELCDASIQEVGPTVEANIRPVYIESSHAILTYVKSRVCQKDASGSYVFRSRQALIFLRVASYVQSLFHYKHSASSEPTPLALVITGAGGTGKSWLYNEIRSLFSLIWGVKSVKIVAFSNSAASLVDGSTIHNVAKIAIPNFQKKKTSLTHKEKDQLKATWTGCQMLLIDEISFVSTDLLLDLNTSLQIALDNDRPFGGLSVVAGGDFMQLRPVSKKSLADVLPFIDVDDPSTSKHVAKSYQGQQLWRNYFNESFELTESNRCTGTLCEFLNCMRSGGKFPPELFTVLKSRLIGYIIDDARQLKYIGKKDDRLSTEFQSATFIVSRHVARTLCSTVAVHNFARRNSSIIEIVQAIDIPEHPLEETQYRKMLENYSLTGTYGTHGIPGLLPLTRGAHYRLTDQECRSQKLVKGTECQLIDIVYHEEEFNCPHPIYDNCRLLYFLPRYLVLRALDSDQNVRNFRFHMCDEPEICELCINGAGYFLLFPSARKWYSLCSDNTTITVSRTGFQLIPSKAITVHSSQGMTLPKIVLDLRCSPRMKRDDYWMQTYVQLSRARSFEDILLICWPKVEDLMHLEKGPPSFATSEIIRLKKLEPNMLRNISNDFQSLRDLFGSQ